MLSPIHIAVLDTETTGLSAVTDRIIEVAVKLLAVDSAGRLLSEVAVYQSLHDPGIRIPRDAIAVHGITDAMVRGHRIDADQLSGILGRADLVVAHNSGFDKGFVRQVVPHADTLLWGLFLPRHPVEAALPAAVEHVAAGAGAVPEAADRHGAPGDGRRRDDRQPAAAGRAQRRGARGALDAAEVARQGVMLQRLSMYFA